MIFDFDVDPNSTGWCGHQVAAKIAQFTIIIIAQSMLKPPGGHTVKHNILATGKYSEFPALLES